MRRRLAFLCAVLVLTLLPALQARAQAGATARIGQVDDARFPTITTAVTVTDGRGLPMSGLGRDRWELLDGEQPVTDFDVRPAVDTALPLAIVLSIDASATFQGPPLAAAKSLAHEFVRGLGPKDQMALVLFARQDRIVQPFTRDRDVLTRPIDALQAGGGTALYDAVALAVERARDTEGRRIVVMMTDGREAGSRRSLADAIDTLGARSATLFLIGLGPAANHAEIDRLAQQSGGVALYAPSPDDLRQAYQRITDQLRNQYLVTLGSKRPADGKRHELTVRVRTDEGTATATAGYVATQNAPKLEIVTPRPGAAVSGQQEVTFRVTAVAPLTAVELSVDDRPVANAKPNPPVTAAEGRATITFDASTLGDGEHRLTLVVRDAAGNWALQTIPVRVGAPPSVQPAAPAESPTPVASLRRAIPYLGVLVVAALAVAVAVWLKRRSRAPSGVCPHHGVRFDKDGLCPICKAESQKRIMERLAEIGGRPADGGPGLER